MICYRGRALLFVSLHYNKIDDIIIIDHLENTKKNIFKTSSAQMGSYSMESVGVICIKCELL